MQCLCASEAEKQDLDVDYATHLGNKLTTCELKSIDIKTAIAEKPNNSVVACYDLHKILSSPQFEVSAFHYKRKLAVYNFTVLYTVTKEIFCYLWN